MVSNSTCCLIPKDLVEPRSCTVRYVCCLAKSAPARCGSPGPPSLRECQMIYAIIVGILAGWLAGQIMKGGGYGVLIDLLLGLLGGIIGGWLFGMLGIGGGGLVWQI